MTMSVDGGDVLRSSISRHRCCCDSRSPAARGPPREEKRREFEKPSLVASGLQTPDTQSEHVLMAEIQARCDAHTAEVEVEESKSI